MSETTAEPTVVLQSVRKEFGSYVAVEHADFAIRAGEFFSLLGPSGCGKTTLLKMIAGFEQPSAGAVLLEGVDVSSVPPHKRNVNTVFQQYALFPHLSIVDNVAFGLRSKKVPATEARTRSMEMLDVVKLTEFANRRPNQLSGGQQQRVALARALVNLPAALLLDEPLAALDLKLREAMQIELKRIQRDVGITFVFVTHDQGEALTMSDRIAVMSRGRVEQIGTPSEIYDRPETIFVAGFIGSANLLPGKVSAPLKVQLAVGPTIDVPLLPSGATGSGEDVTVMLRPERLTPTVDTVAGRSVTGRIDDVIYQGSETLLIVHLEDETEVLVTIDPDHATAATKVGNQVTLTWSPDAPFVMPGRTAIVGATGTDFNEVEATMAGDLDADDDVEGGEGHPNAAPPATPEKLRNEGRRKLLIGSGVAIVAGLGAVGLSNVGSNEGGSSGTSSSSGGAAGGGLGQGDTDLNIINWTEYIDPTADGESGTIDLFSKEFNVKTNYS
ncbi:MAG: polyamine ABC transporter ATP-binding protein, partial [Microthrixaceae bacterium]